MRAVLLIPESGAHLTELLGMPVGQRALFALSDAGAANVEVDRAAEPYAQVQSRMQL